jgi:hypothetical protein
VSQSEVLISAVQYCNPWVINRLLIIALFLLDMLLFNCLRFQEIAGGLESSLAGPIKPIESEGTTEKLLLKQSIKLLESLKICWSDDVLVFSHSDKFLRLSLQLLARLAYFSLLSIKIT